MEDNFNGSETVTTDDELGDVHQPAVSSDQPDVSLIPLSANHPVLSFPLRTFGKQRRAFCSSWYRSYPWLHYQEATDSVLCFHCHVADMRGLPVTQNKDQAFTKLGFSNWKKAIEKFNKHELSTAHHQAVELVENIPKTTKNVGQMLSGIHAKEQAENRVMLRMILTSIRFLARQGLALRGRFKVADDQAEGSEVDSNFIQLLKVRAEDNPSILKWMEKSQDKFTSAEIQNEILSIMAQSILREISSEVSGKWFTIMVDETTDLNNVEQMVFCLRFVSDDLEVHEEFIGLYSLESTSAESIVGAIKDILLRLNLQITNCRGQCYDGASSMSGVKSGVAVKIKELEPRALYTHCYGHALNLAAQDSIKNLTIMEDTLDTTYEITKLIKKSPKREVLFRKFKDEVKPGSTGIRTLCPTRWTVKAEAFTSISENYQALQQTWEEAKRATKDTEMRARIVGVAAQMKNFDYFFGLELGRKCLAIADNLSRSLQSSTLSACEGQEIVKSSLTTLQSIRCDQHFDLFWKYVEKRKCDGDVSTPELPRRKRRPQRYEIGEAAPEYPDGVQDHYRRIYFEVLDYIIATIKERFKQKDYLMLEKLELILKTPNPSPEVIKNVCDFYKSDLNHSRLCAQLTMLHTGTDITGLTDLKSIIIFLRGLNATGKEGYSEVIKVMKLILVSPATNALSERSFSALRRVKTWLRTRMGQARLNWCMTMHVHKMMTDNMSIINIANEFVQRNSSRMHIFGKF